MSENVIRFKQEPLKITYMLQIAYLESLPSAVNVSRTDVSGEPRYYVTAFMSSWNELDEMRGPLQDLERQLRSGRVTVEAEDSRLFSLVAGELQET